MRLLSKKEIITHALLMFHKGPLSYSRFLKGGGGHLSSRLAAIVL